MQQGSARKESDPHVSLMNFVASFELVRRRRRCLPPSLSLRRRPDYGGPAFDRSPSRNRDRPGAARLVGSRGPSRRVRTATFVASS
ncbi:hypothetical protein VARIO8X_60011 [Burkholderiales bacterium 8X]|nr:hypothetical protein VARIO8X_60011 [Burkholderiales bacterium 8X]